MNCRDCKFFDTWGGEIPYKNFGYCQNEKNRSLFMDDLGSIIGCPVSADFGCINFEEGKYEVKDGEEN